ncbi:MAG: dynamin family protein [Chloroflexota bacterium]|nr:dynamin family protein [Chloroflexota bacterium]
MVRGLFQFPGRARRPSRGGADGAILSARQQELVAIELAVLERLSRVLDEYPGTDEDRLAIRQAAEQLTALFMLVIVGEFNAGKSAFINALVGAEVMPEGVTPTTSVINLLQFGDTRTETMQADGIIVRTYPVDFLDDITIVDTPGTNAIIREHETLTQRFVPRSDLVLFVTSADRPFTESEREFMATIRDWGKKIVVIINKVDLLRDEKSVAEVVEFVRESIQRLLGFTPEIFPVSALLAEQAKALGDKNPDERRRLWERSRYEPLERYIIRTLDQEGRVRLKLLNPLGVADHLTTLYQAATEERLTILKDDVTTIENIERQLTLYQEDMRRQFGYHLTRVENIIARMLSRGDQFFEDTIRIGRIFDLIKTDRIRAEFEQVVVGDTERRIDATIDELIDWMVEQDLRTWQAVNEYIDRRRLSRYEDDLIGEVGGLFRYDRKALLDAVSSRASEAIEQYNPKAEAHELSRSVRNAVATVAVAEAGAVGLGALVVAAASTAAVDITGILAASVLAGIGLFVLPMKRRQARRDFHERADELERRLVEVMREQFDHELERSVERIREAISPYTRFVRTQTERLTGYEAELAAIANELRSLRHEVGGDPDDGDPASRLPVLPSLPATTAETPAGPRFRRLTNGAGQPAPEQTPTTPGDG